MPVLFFSFESFSFGRDTDLPTRFEGREVSANSFRRMIVRVGLSHATEHSSSFHDDDPTNGQRHLGFDNACPFFRSLTRIEFTMVVPFRQSSMSLYACKQGLTLSRPHREPSHGKSRLEIQCGAGVPSRHSSNITETVNRV